MTYDLGFQSLASYDHDPGVQKIKVKVKSKVSWFMVQKLEWKQTDGQDRLQ